MDQRLQGLPLVVQKTRNASLGDGIAGLFVVGVFVALLVVLP